MTEPNRPSLREAARRGVEANQKAKQAAPPSKPAQNAKPALATAKASCGHEVQFDLPGKPAFAESKRKSIEDRPCDDCRRKAVADHEAAEQEAARQRRAERAARPNPRLGRLPDGSTFHVVYDAEAVKWTGRLTVPMGGVYNASVTEGEDSALFALLMKLDRAYRKLPMEEPAPAVSPAE